jgi:hypothetical protein
LNGKDNSSRDQLEMRLSSPSLRSLGFAALLLSISSTTQKIHGFSFRPPSTSQTSRSKGATSVDDLLDRSEKSSISYSSLEALAKTNVLGYADQGDHSHGDTKNWKDHLGHCVLPLLLVALSITVLSSAAIATSFPDASVFNHEYADPLHPECKRKIEVSRDRQNFHYSGTAVGPKDDPILRGCTVAEIRDYGIRRGNFDGKILPDLTLDAGDGIHIGTWEPANSMSVEASYEEGDLQKYSDVDGIRWKDGNKWIVKDKSFAALAGEYLFLAYIGVSTLAGVKVAVEYIQRKQQDANESI